MKVSVNWNERMTFEANTEYTMRATAAFKNIDPASGSCFVNFYYGETWGDIFAVTADAAEATDLVKKYMA